MQVWPDQDIETEKEYAGLIQEIINAYSPSTKIWFMDDPYVWLKENGLLKENDSPFPIAKAVNRGDGLKIVVVKRRITADEIKSVTGRIKGLELIGGRQDFIRHLTLHEICHIKYFNGDVSPDDDFCDTWAFEEMVSSERGS